MLFQVAITWSLFDLHNFKVNNNDCNKRKIHGTINVSWSYKEKVDLTWNSRKLFDRRQQINFQLYSFVRSRIYRKCKYIHYAAFIQEFSILDNIKETHFQEIL